MDVVLLVKAAIMGVVEGLTEFLPISSTGHLILAGSLLGFDDAKAKVFDIAIQTGAIFAVILVYWAKIRSTLVALPTERQAQRFALNVFIAFVPAVVLGLLFGSVTGILLGVLSAVLRNTAPDYLLRSLSILGSRSSATSEGQTPRASR